MLDKIKQINSLEELQALYSDTFGKNGTMTAALKEMKNLDNDARAALNQENTELREAFKIRQIKIEDAVMIRSLEKQKLDMTAPTDTNNGTGAGKLHPLTQSLAEITAIFESMGYGLRTGPEIEDDWHNFTALNVPKHHPARDMQDSFFVTGGNVLRTQTSAVQIRAMENEGVPIKIFCPGATYRKEMDATHFPMFHQIEGLVIGPGVTISDMVNNLKTFFQLYFGISDIPLRIRPSYFPFTEPSIEVDLKWDKKTGTLGQGEDWLEIVPGGMVHPNVLSAVGVDPNKHQGFAFGFGWDRIVMLKYGLPDGRKFFEGDIRWLKNNGFLGK
ncbi:MAG: phenylalanine--tRNA ligase subunit alpha [Rickettsiales bacterium]|jgi:phenylalanyl-tRNA synthetase alpha chain|nr:phenylalanine--tRNA ligase subunit alpha [Rickettsiales bacterium]